MASTEEAPEPLKYQTWVLRVSIHCEGCKKKVKKVLQGIDGVYKITTDSQQQKVMVTGNVEAETLIKKLGKTGKHAELWPEPKPANPDSIPNSSSNNNNNSSNGGGSGGKKKNNNNNNRNKPPNEPSEQPETKGPESDNGTASAAKSDTEPVEESPKPDKKDSEAASPPAEKPSCGGGGGKKKGKKGNSGGDDCGGDGSGGEALAEEGQKVEVAAAAAAAMSPVPCQHVYHYPMYQVPAMGPPTYFATYNTTVQPLAVGSCYIPLAAAAAATATASYDIFSEENANACTVM